MPFVTVYLRRGKSPEFVRSIGDAIHEALVTEANVPKDDRFHVFVELADHLLVADPSYGGVNRSADLVIIQITLNVGRTLEIKKKLYAAIASRLQSAVDLRSDDVLISLVEVTKEDWSFGGGRATYA
jgi:4-oxalocrotonate tautomerase